MECFCVRLSLLEVPPPVPQDAVKCLPKAPHGCGTIKQARRLRVTPKGRSPFGVTLRNPFLTPLFTWYEYKTMQKTSPVFNEGGFVVCHI